MGERRDNARSPVLAFQFAFFIFQFAFFNPQFPRAISPAAARVVVKGGTGITTFAGSNTYTGGTTINTGILAAVASTTSGSGATESITNGPTGTGLLTVNGGTLDLSTFSVAVGGLSGSGGTIASSSTGTAGSLTIVTGATPQTYSGVIANTTGGGSKTVSVNIAGSGTQIFSAANTFTGVTTISSGTLQLGNGTNTTANVGGNITLAGGALKLDYNASSYSSYGNSLTLTGSATIGNLGSQVNLTGTFNGGNQILTVDNGTDTNYLYFNGTFGSSLSQVNIVNGAVGLDGNTGTPLRNAPITVSSGAAFATYTTPTINNNFTLNGGSGPAGLGVLQAVHAEDRHARHGPAGNTQFRPRRLHPQHQQFHQQQHRLCTRIQPGHIVRFQRCRLGPGDSVHRNSRAGNGNADSRRRNADADEPPKAAALARGGRAGDRRQ